MGRPAGAGAACAAALSLALLSGCAALCPCSPPHRPSAALLKTWLAEHPMPLDQDITADELLRTPDHSLHVVRIRDREPAHVHARHDLTFMLCRGRGLLELGPKTLELAPGDVAAIPRGTPHTFLNTAVDPAVLFLRFTPPYDGTDRVPVD